ncbi:type 1 glutamine amidotransferase [Streptomyces sp. V4-01]|uniref:Type 1 glutamine amidotransferase n=1 Tax=Actinacidiphila polyblastidii TaxID=3110430 RepID=A0ABU7PCB1_9ACTN|nr:type 1 glutamine amidotransferase [Streptomyces sp. V4-01]
MTTTAAATALVVQNTPGGGPGRWAGWLREAGLALDVVAAYEDPAALPERLTHQALLVLGGGYLPDEDARAPWLARTRDLTRQALDAGVPVFGICLGGQLLAHVAGGEVRGRYGRPEFGSTPLRLRAEAADDPLFGGLPEAPRAMENHVDAIVRLPPGARWLAESERCPHQAFRVDGAPAWGVQFHPEAAADRIQRWDAERLAGYGEDRAVLHRAALADEAASVPTWRRLAHAFALQATSRAA